MLQEKWYDLKQTMEIYFLISQLIVHRSIN